MNFLLFGSGLKMGRCLVIAVLYIFLMPRVGKAQLDTAFKLFPIPKKITAQPGVGMLHMPRHVYYADDIFPFKLSKEMSSLARVKRVVDGGIQLFLDSEMELPVNAEGYRIQIANNVIKIKAKERSGLFYGLQTIKQLIQDMKEHNIPIPACDILDYPDVSHRAVHIDLKHHLDDMPYYYSVIDRLAEIKVNAVILEFEDKLRYEHTPLIGADHAFSIDEFRALSDYAQERFIKISPLIQGLGHASFILKHPTYRSLREDPLSDWAFSPLDSGTYAILFNLYDEALKATPYGEYIHIGGDEVGQLGQSTLSKESGMSAFELQMYWLNKVSSYIISRGRIPIFWDDMVFKLKGLYETTYDDSMPIDSAKMHWVKSLKLLQDNIALFPKECIFMRWNYSTPWAYGNNRAIKWYRDNGLKIMGATAAQQVAPMMPRDQSNFKSIKAFAEIAKNSEMQHMLCTVWDDSSPHFETVWRGLYYFAAMNWNYVEIDSHTANISFLQRFYGLNYKDSVYTFQDKLEESLKFWDRALLERGHRYKFPNDTNETKILNIPLTMGDSNWSLSQKERLDNARKCVKLYEELRKEIRKSQNLALRNHFALQIFEQINELHVYPAHVLLLLERYDKANEDSTKLVVKKELSALLDEFESLRSSFSKIFYLQRLHNPIDYLLDSNFHQHLANGTQNDDWMFVFELMFIANLREWLQDQTP